MPPPRADVECLLAVMQGVHRPEHGDPMLCPVPEIFEKIFGEKIAEQRWREPPAVGPQSDNPAARLVHRENRKCASKWGEKPRHADVDHRVFEIKKQGCGRLIRLDGPPPLDRSPGADEERSEPEPDEKIDI